MKKYILVLLILCTFILKTAAQQNWAAVPCSKMALIDAVNRMFIDSLHNEIILYSLYGDKICNKTYKGIYAYGANGFRDMDYGIDKFKLTSSSAGAEVRCSITLGNKTLIGGVFNSVGSDTLYAKSIALWDGNKWSSFPIPVFDNTPNFSSGGGFAGFLKYQNKLWMYGSFDTIGNTITKNLTAFDGYTFTSVPPVPVLDNNYPFTKVIAYKNKLIATGNFDDYPNSSKMCRLAQFDGTTWSSMGSGVQGGLSACQTMAVYKDTLYIAGAFPKSAGNAGNYIMKWDGNQLYDAGFGSFCGYGQIYSLIPFRNRLYAFGGFACAANQKAFGMAYYENGKWTVSTDSVDNLITSAVLYNDAIYIGGGFTSINGDTTIQKFAKLLCPDFDAASGCLSGVKENSRNRLNLKVFPNPASDKLFIESDFNEKVEKLNLTNALGQEVFTLYNPENKQEVDISTLPAGIYFLKAENQQGQSVFKLLKE